MNLLERVKDLCSEKGISQRKLEIDLGLSNGASSKWNKSSPSGDVLDKVANYFDVSVDYLLGKEFFKNKSEANYSISVASIKYLMKNKNEIPNNYGIDTGLIYLQDEGVNEGIWNYCYNLLNKFENNIILEDLDYFELSNIIFSEIKWTKDPSGIVYLKNYNDETITIKLDFNKIKKLNAASLNIDDSFLLKSMGATDDSFTKYNSIFLTVNTREGNDVTEVKPSKPTTIAAHLPDGVELTEEEEKDLDDYIQFLLSRRKE